MRILIFGDSTAQGYYDLEMGGWVNLLFIHIMKQRVRRTDYPIEIFNLSISGDTTRRVMARLKAETENRRWEDEPIVLIFAVGVNDAVIDNNKPISTPQKYRAELEELYTIAQSCAEHSMFVGLEAVDETESAPWKYNSGRHQLVWKNERIQLFDMTLRDFTKEKDLPYVRIFDIFRERQQKGEKLHADGLHPNNTGHKLIYDQVRIAIDRLLQENNTAQE